ncbi:unnamed protein product [Dovyalis caffra]|uniref:Uncharacterized protein n=1 Tax=Dovyalis caffra TaxID=77055 RepID=A0AAV1SMH6_9ROSI|nr:unnamed protein product [Dovyalis caffra]
MDSHESCQSRFGPHVDAVFKVENRMLFLEMECPAGNSERCCCCAVGQSAIWE